MENPPFSDKTYCTPKTGVCQEKDSLYFVPEPPPSPSSSLLNRLASTGEKNFLRAWDVLGNKFIGKKHGTPVLQEFADAAAQFLAGSGKKTVCPKKAFQI